MILDIAEDRVLVETRDQLFRKYLKTMEIIRIYRLLSRDDMDLQETLVTIIINTDVKGEIHFPSYRYVSSEEIENELVIRVAE